MSESVRGKHNLTANDKAGASPVGWPTANDQPVGFQGFVSLSFNVVATLRQCVGRQAGRTCFADQESF